MAKQYKTKSGKTRTWFSPKEKFTKYSKDLDKGCDTKTGKVLSDSDRAYRKGYKKALGEQAALFNKKNSTR